MSCSINRKDEMIGTVGDARKKAETKADTVVLVNAGNIDRCQIGNLIGAISNCNPKVLGVNFAFTERKDA